MLANSLTSVNFRSGVEAAQYVYVIARPDGTVGEVRGGHRFDFGTVAANGNHVRMAQSKPT